MGTTRMARRMASFGQGCWLVFHVVIHLHGNIRTTDGTISGNSISYIYPDMETTFLGIFEDRVMKDTQESTVLNVDCDENGMLYVSKYSLPESFAPHFYYAPPTNESFGAGPPGIRNPYERKWLELKTSSNPLAGEGVFIKRDVDKDVFVSIYSGFVYRAAQRHIYLQNCIENTTKSDEERRHCKKYSLMIRSIKSMIEIPPEYDQPGMFLRSLGPKVFLVTYDTTPLKLIFKTKTIF